MSLVPEMTSVSEVVLMAEMIFVSRKVRSLVLCGQRLVVDSDGHYIEQSLEVLCQRLNDDRRENLCSRLQTLYKLVQETENKRDIAPPEERSRLQLVACGHFREFHRTFVRFCDLVNKPLQKLLLAELQLDRSLRVSYPTQKNL
jgi:hypothetical protein